MAAGGVGSESEAGEVSSACTAHTPQTREQTNEQMQLDSTEMKWSIERIRKLKRQRKRKRKRNQKTYAVALHHRTPCENAQVW